MTSQSDSSGSVPDACAGKDVNCDEALAEIYLLLDHECSQNHAAELRRHLDDCPPCLEQYGIDEQLKELLHRKCGGDQAPEQLRAKLRASIRETVTRRGNMTVEQTEIRIEHTE